MQEYIHVKGAREHNLKNIDIKIPRDKLVVFTGLSGSGKSSLAFDTIYAEGQRRYVESLSSYARQFLGQMDKPDVDYIDGLSPAISIDQKTTSQNPRSTVGTVTEIYDYMRLLWARIGTPHCPKCGKEIHQQTIDQIIDRLMALEEKTRVQLLAPVIRGKKGEHVKVFENARKQGYVRVRVDGEIHDLSEEFKLAKTKKHNIEIVVDRVVIRPDARGRITDSVETASALSGGLVIADVIGGEPLTFSQNYACDDCGIFHRRAYPENVLIQQSVRCVPSVHRSGHSEACRSRPRHSEPPPFHQAGRHSRVRVGERRHRQHRGDVLQCTRQKARFYAGNAHRGVLRAGARRAAVRHGRRAA